MARNSRFSLTLTAHWKISTDALQWLLEVRGCKDGELGPWKPRSFCVTRKCLLQCIREYCGPVNIETLDAIQGWPETYPYKKRIRARKAA